MKILYVFPHPDDESFGPAAAIAKQVRQGHDVYLLTLTKGGATKQRHKLGLSVEEMGEVRYKEMLCVEKVLGLKGMTVLDLPDGGLAEMDPREIEKVVHDQIEELQPEIVVSYAVYGVSGFYDHLVMHAVIKRVYLEMKDNGVQYLKRLAFFGLGESNKAGDADSPFQLKRSEPALIDCIVEISEADVEKMCQALDCYESYKEVIEKTGVKNAVTDKVYFEIFGEDYMPELKDLTDFPTATG
ncbi:MAG: PIG-L family deacetylase [Bacteroidia bacterium]